VTVQSSLIKRSRSHFHVFEWGVEVILGLNGYVWIGKPRKTPNQQDLDSLYSSELDLTSFEEKQAIARTRNVIVALDRVFISIEEETIRKVCQLSMPLEIKDILGSSFISQLLKIKLNPSN
jgi:exosome complex component RRP4